MKQSFLKNSTRTSPLEQIQRLKNGESSKHKPDMAPVLQLTSLIDAFSIIVIYLLIASQSGGIEVNTSKNIQLPIAESGVALEKESAIVRIENGRYFINDEFVATSNLGAKLYELKKKLAAEDNEIMIQADQAMNYADLDPLLRAGSEAGIQKLKFAVLPNK